MSLRRQGVVLGGEAIIIPLQGDIRSLDVVVNPAAGASALVEYTASDHFVGASKQVGVSQLAPAATFIAPDSLTVADFAAHGITQPGQVFEIVGSASNDGFYRILEFLSGPSSPGSVGSQFAASGSVYAINARDFPTGEADSDNFTVSFWVRQPAGYAVTGASFFKTVLGSLRNTATEPAFAGSAPYDFSMSRTAPTTMNIATFPAGFIILPNSGFADSWPGDGLWHHVLISADLSLSASHIYVDGVDEKSFAILHPTTVQWEDPADHLTHSIGGIQTRLFLPEPSVQVILDAELSEIFFDPQNYLDFSIPGNRELFRTSGGNPVPLGPVGATPTGAQPAVYCPDGDPAANVGRWGPYTLVAGTEVAQTPVVATVGPALDTARVLPVDGGMINEDAAPDVGVFSGPSGGAGSIWLPWSEGLVTAEAQADVPASSSALMVTATAGDVEFVVNGGKSRALVSAAAAPPLGPTPGFGEANYYLDRWNRIKSNPGTVDGRLGTFSGWFKMDESTGEDTWLYGVNVSNQHSVYIRFAIGGGGQYKCNINLFAPNGNTLMTFAHADGFVVGQWHHVMASWDHAFPIDAAANMSMWFDGVESINGVNNAFLVEQNNDFDIGYSARGNQWTYGARSELFDGGSFGGPISFRGCASAFYLNTTERIDLDVQANREKFRGAGGEVVDLGADGSLPSGSQPLFYFPDGDPVVNLGYGSALPHITGTVVDCPNTPPTGEVYAGLATEHAAVHMEDTNGPLVSGQADGRLVTWSFWFKSTSDQNQDILRIQNNVAQQSLYIRLSAPRGQALTVNTIASTSNALIAVSPATSSSQIADGWNHFMGSMEHVLPQNEVVNITAYFNGALIVDGVLGANLDQQASDLDIAYNARGEEVVYGSSGFGTAFLRGCISNFYVNIEERLDLTIQANREKFYSGTGGNVYLGTDGSLPTGSQPFLYAEDGDLRVNNGYGPSLSLIAGVVSACVDKPPES